MRATFHLVPAELWTVADRGIPFAAASLETEGFIHCTDGVEALRATFDRYYAADPRQFHVLTVDLDQLDVPWRFDVAGSPYPHIYGPIVRSAIVATARVVRDEDGRFLRLGSA